MIQDVNFWLQFICGIIVGRGVIVETEVGRKFLGFVSKLKLCLTNEKINLYTVIVPAILLFFFNLPLPIALMILIVWRKIPTIIKEYENKEFFKGLKSTCVYWLIFSFVVWWLEEKPTDFYPYSLILELTKDKNSVLAYGVVAMVGIAILFDCLILFIVLPIQKLISGEGLFVFATIAFFVICPIVEYTKWNTFQDVIQCIKTKKDSFYNRLHFIP